MLKKRLIACLLIKNDLIVQSIGFNKYLPIGNPKFPLEFLNKWDVDEIILLDIGAYKEKKKLNLKILELLSKDALASLTIPKSLPIELISSILLFPSFKGSL